MAVHSIPRLVRFGLWLQVLANMEQLLGFAGFCFNDHLFSSVGSGWLNTARTSKMIHGVKLMF